jgi:hypothetical protein
MTMSSEMLQVTRRIASASLRQLVDEFRLLTSAFPDLRDAFDPDELPIDFILKQGAQLEPVTPPTVRRAGLKDPASDD